jgi:dihydrofolate synthase / folylpolyglutamate synthase
MSAAGTPLATWLTRLETLSPREIVLGLERVEAVLGRLTYRAPSCVVHVAGTNGKGSCVEMLGALLAAGGARVGCYTSPHLYRYNERIRVDGHEAGDDAIIAAFERIEAVRGDVPLTYFEYGTLAALLVFSDAGVEAAVLEVGMGGRLDAVNAIEPDAGLITNVTLDHCEWLGPDVETIAVEKAGIMRRGKPVVFGAKEVPRNIVREAERIGARLLLAGRDFDGSPVGDGWSWRGATTRLDALARPSLEGEHQLENAAAVLALLEALGHFELLRAAVVDSALTKLAIPGRMQRFGNGPRWLFDVAHNPGAAAVLARVLRAGTRQGRTIAIFGMLDDKDVAGVLSSLRDHVDVWIAVTAESPRAIPADELARRMTNQVNAECLVAGSIGEAMGQARRIAEPGDRILVTGSFYVVGPALNLLTAEAGSADRG